MEIQEIKEKVSERVELDRTIGNNRFVTKARILASAALNEVMKENGFEKFANLRFSDMYVVWFSKTLQNWKALVSTDTLDTEHYGVPNYVEVTYNGDKQETYCDVYRKGKSICYKD